MYYSALCRLVGLIANFIKLLKLSCRDHKTFSLHLGLHIGYKDYICLLTYSINCIFPTTMNIHIYLFTVVIVMSEQNCLFAAVRAVVGLSHCR